MCVCEGVTVHEMSHGLFDNTIIVTIAIDTKYDQHVRSAEIAIKIIFLARTKRTRNNNN